MLMSFLAGIDPPANQDPALPRASVKMWFSRGPFYISLAVLSHKRLLNVSYCTVLVLLQTVCIKKPITLHYFTSRRSCLWNGGLLRWAVLGKRLYSFVSTQQARLISSSYLILSTDVLLCAAATTQIWRCCQVLRLIHQPVRLPWNGFKHISASTFITVALMISNVIVVWDLSTNTL